MDYDVLILGGGIIGCAAAYELSKYNLNIAVIEKDYDIADDISFGNTAIVFDGSETKDDLMSKLEHIGNSMLPNITKKFNVPFKRTGSLRVVQDEEGVKILEDMYNRAKKRGIENIYLIDDKAVYDIEPHLKINVKKALYSGNTGVICPYDLAIAYAEVAFDNGVIFRLEEIVQDIQKIAKGFKVTTNKNKFTCRVVINTIPGDNYTIDSIRNTVRSNDRKMQYLLLDERFKYKLSNVVTKVKGEDSVINQIPTLSAGTLVGITTDRHLGFKELLEEVSNLIPEVTKDDVNSIFYDDYNKDLMFIDHSNSIKGYIKITGKHYAEITIAPSLSKMLCEAVVNNLNAALKKNFIDKRRDFYRFRDMTKEQRNEAILLDKRYGKIICLCNKVSEGEIVDSIRRPLGARTVEGVKRRTGAAFGNCHGAYCISKIIDILAREMDKKPTEIVGDSKNSKVLASRIKEFNDM